MPDMTYCQRFFLILIPLIFHSDKTGRLSGIRQTARFLLGDMKSGEAAGLSLSL
jgi:hypothetical protein